MRKMTLEAGAIAKWRKSNYPFVGWLPVEADGQQVDGHI